MKRVDRIDTRVKDSAGKQRKQAKGNVRDEGG